MIPPRPTDAALAEEHLLNARLDAQRRWMAGDLTGEELDAIEREVATALRSVRLLAWALLPTRGTAREGAQS